MFLPLRRRHASYMKNPIFEAAAKQHGLVSRRELLAAGVSPGVIRRHLRAGLLRRLHAGVYVAGVVLPERWRERAALMACGCGVISRHSASALWEMLPAKRASDCVDVWLPPGRQRGKRPGICAHRGHMQPDEVTTLHGLPVTTPARTLLDLGSIGPKLLDRALAVAERRDARIRERVKELLERYPRRSGTRALRALIMDPHAGAFTRSPAENVLLELIRASGLPTPATNVVVHNIEVDCYWKSAKLVVEVDGYEHHSAHVAFVRDRQRDAVLLAAGLRVLRLSWHQLTAERDRTLVQLAQALAPRS